MKLKGMKILKTTKLESVLWSIALPGFGQILNQQLFKGIFFFLIELIINVKSRFNDVILLSFNGHIQEALELADTQWLLFYPCFYMFVMYDAFKYATGDTPELAFLPFLLGAFFVTVGLLFSHTIKVFNLLLGPVFLPMFFLLPGLFAGFILRQLLLFFNRKHA